MATEAAARKFFTAPYFAVTPSQASPRYCYIDTYAVHAWYLLHELNVTPINPASAAVSVLGEDRPTLPNLSALPNPKETAVSIITHPAITVNILKEAKQAGVPSIWMQPGTFDDEVLKVALEEGAFQSVVYGDGGRGSEGWCVLVDGEKAMKDAGKL